MVQQLPLRISMAAFVYLLLGFLLIAAPNVSRKLLCALVGAGMLVYGLLTIIPRLFRQGEKSFSLTLLLGICALAFGIFSLFNPAFVMDFLFTVMGVIVCLASINGIRRALDLRRLGFMRWSVLLISSLTTLALALCVVFFPGFFGGMLIMVVGLILAAQAICDLISTHLLTEYAGRPNATHQTADR